MKKEPFIANSEEYLQLENWIKIAPNLNAGFSTRRNGYSQNGFESLNIGLHVNDDPHHVIQNRKKIADIISSPLESWVCKEQVHDNKIVKMSKEDCGVGTLRYEDGIKGTDGIYTSDKGVLLTSCYADCVPLYFLSPKSNLIGLAHAGWKGTVKNIAKEMIHTWVQEEKADIDDILVAIGPSIGSCCYIVNDLVKNQVTDVLASPFSAVGRETAPEQYTLDLKEVNRLLILEAGVKEENITISSYCTSCEKEMFFSHRRDQGKTGRMMSFIGWKEGTDFEH